MAKIALNQIQHVARLSKLALTNDEATNYQHTLQDILTYINQLNQLNTTEIKPLTTVLPLQNIMQTNKPQTSLATNTTLTNAPNHNNDYYRMPQIIK